MKTNLLFILALLIGGVMMGQKVTVDMDKTVDFDKYKTFQFIGWQDNCDTILNDFDKKRLKDSFNNELSKRQLEKVQSNPDFTIMLYVVIDVETSITAYTDYYGNTGYRRWGAWGWGNGYATTTYVESDYLKGTLVMDVFDAESEKLIWQGVASKTIPEKPEQREKRIPKTVAKLMKEFPIGNFTGK